jgi:glycosyltransferase involved in cell wall biosynthesis
MRILYLTYDISWPLSYGAEIRSWHVLQGLLQAGETDVVVFCTHWRPVAKEAFAGCGRVVQINGCRPGLGERNRRWYESTLGRGALTFGSLLPFQYQGEVHAELRARLRREVDFGAYDLVWFFTARTAVPTGRVDARATVLDGDDFLYMREWLLLRSSPWYGAKVLNYVDVAKLWWLERSFPRRFSFVVRCSREDRDRHPAANVVVIPNGTLVPSTVCRSPQRKVLFVGHLDYAPNVQGLEWFLDEVWPLIRERVPEATLDIVGKDPGPSMQRVNGKRGVTVHGFVKDLTDLYRTAALSIVPLRAGSGTRLKILECLAHAVPVVSTNVGAYGIGVGVQQGVDLADTPERFAACCVALLVEPDAGRLWATGGREFVGSNYDWRLVQQQVKRLAHRAVGERE